MKQHGSKGLPEETIIAETMGHAGQSLGAFTPKGLLIHHTGDANDYVRKGLSGGTVVVKAPKHARENEVVVGNVCFYGASSDKVYINGSAGEHFYIRNSGVDVAVEGIGDHGLEYMTGGHMVIPGSVGKNSGQGMSGGVSYIFPSDTEAFRKANQLSTLAFKHMQHDEEKQLLKSMLEEHYRYTESTKAKDILNQSENVTEHAIKVIPKDYELMMQKVELQRRHLSEGSEAKLVTFYDHRTSTKKDLQSAVIY